MFKRLKDQRGLTLIELLVVVVILGIISAIAVPSVGGLIDNSKKDAHAANAMQMINATKLAVTGDNTARPAANSFRYIPLGWLEAQGYIEPIKDPDGGNYTSGGTSILTTVPAATGSYVLVSADADNKITYSVYTTNGVRGVRVAAANNGTAAGHYVAEANVNRGNVFKQP